MKHKGEGDGLVDGSGPGGSQHRTAGFFPAINKRLVTGMKLPD